MGLNKAVQCIALTKGRYNKIALKHCSNVHTMTKVTLTVHDMTFHRHLVFNSFEGCVKFI